MTTGQVNPYARNPFRLLGLCVSATDWEVRRRAEDIRVRAELQVDASAIAALEHIRGAVAVLEDPVKRLHEEVYWLHRASEDSSPTLDPCDGEASSAALSALRQLADAGSDEALHDLAVLSHVAAIERRKDDLQSWQQALHYWRDVWGSESFWLRLRLRAEGLDDPRANAAAVETLRTNLPEEVLGPSAARVAELLEAGLDQQAASHLKMMDSSGFPTAAVGAARTRATAPLHARAQLLVAELNEDIGAASTSIHPLGMVLADAWARAQSELVPLIERLRCVDPASAQVQLISDQVAGALVSLGVRYHNDAKASEAGIAPLELAQRLAASASIQQRAAENLRILQLEVAWRRASEHADAGDWDGAIAVAKQAWEFAADDTERLPITGFIQTCHFRIAFQRAGAHASAKHWAQAIVAGEAARKETNNPDECSAVDRFIARCRDARRRRRGAWTRLIGGGLAVLGLLIGLSVVVTSSSSATATKQPTPVATVRAQPSKNDLRQQLDRLKGEIDAARPRLDALESDLKQKSREIDAMSPGAARNAAIDDYNRRVTDYKSRLAAFNADVDRYNSLLAQYRSL